MIVVYRLLISISHSAWAIRLGAVVAGVAITLLLVAIARLLASPSAGFLAGALYAIAGIGPHIEGYTFNGELAAAVPAAAAVSVAVVAWQRDSRRWLVAAAALGGSAMLMKQSGFDGLAVVFAVALLSRERLKSVALVVAGAAVPLGASVIAGWLSGWRSYWSAVVADHVGAATAASRPAHLLASLPAAARDLLPLAVVALVGLWLSRKQSPQLRAPFMMGPRRRGAMVGSWQGRRECPYQQIRARLRTPPGAVQRGPADQCFIVKGALRLGLVWLAAALAGVNVGGLYWPHYYVQLLPPLCLLAALGLARLPNHRLAWATAGVIALPALGFVAGVVKAPEPKQELMVKYALGFENDQRIARYVRAHSSSGDDVYALDSRADFYFLASRSAASPYLWAHPLQAIPGALASLERTLESPRRPRLVVLFQRSPLHRYRLLRAIVDRYYREIWRAPGTGTPVLASFGRSLG